MYSVRVTTLNVSGARCGGGGPHERLSVCQGAPQCHRHRVSRPQTEGTPCTPAAHYARTSSCRLQGLNTAASPHVAEYCREMLPSKLLCSVLCCPLRFQSAVQLPREHYNGHPIPIFGYNRREGFLDLLFPDFSYFGHEYSQITGAPVLQHVFSIVY